MKILLIILPLFLLIGCVTTMATIEQEKSLEEIKEFPGLTKDELYKNALNWVARSYNSANDVVQLRDPESGQIICRATACQAWQPFVGTQCIYYTMLVDVKNEKARVRIENINSNSPSGRAVLDVAIFWKAIEKHFSKIKEDFFISIKTASKENAW